jgi:hypothetical protein
MAGLDVRPMNCTEGDQHSQERDGRNPGQPDPASPAGPLPGLPPQRSRDLDWIRQVPGGHVESSAHRVWVGIDRD